MKNFKILAMACVALAWFGCKGNNNPDDPNQQGNNNSNPNTPTETVSLELGATQYSVKVGATVQIVANVTPAGTALTYSSLDPSVASVNASGLVTGVAAGNTIVTVTAGTVNKSCIINVVQEGAVTPGEKPVVHGKRIWTIIMDGETADANASKIVFSFAPNGTTRNLWFWEQTYGGNAASGSNFFQTESDGGFLSAIVTDKGWSGMGYSISDADEESKAAADALVAEIKANPAKYHCHMAIKSTQQGSSHYFSLFGLGTNGTGLKWCVGDYYEAESNGKFDIVYDGSWNVIDFAFDRYAASLEAYVNHAGGKGLNILTIGSTGQTGNILNLDAFYIYEVE
ncbi:MAG: Ig-like domain-containing protein [Paludibacteraceae bacterium]|nr:Ig-like domain-containing protein [Paludibacteraceae bacterium]